MCLAQEFCLSHTLLSFSRGPIAARSPARMAARSSGVQCDSDQSLRGSALRASGILIASRVDEVRVSLEHLERSRRQEKLARQFAEQAARFEESLLRSSNAGTGVLGVAALAAGTDGEPEKLPWDSAQEALRHNSEMVANHRYHYSAPAHAAPAAR